MFLDKDRYKVSKVVAHSEVNDQIAIYTRPVNCQPACHCVRNFRDINGD